jgi:hypothetical protein
MPKTFALSITDRWKNSDESTVYIPKYGWMQRVTGMLVVNSQFVADWLISNGYCEYYSPNVPKPEEAVVERKAVVSGNVLELEPALNLLIATPEQQELILKLFNESEPKEINNQIRLIPIKLAEELKAMRPLDWSMIQKSVSDKQLEALIKWTEK